MKHAICVIGFGNNADVLQKTINILDDPNIDFFVHWDARYKMPSLYSKFSTIYYIKERISVKWGGQSLVRVTLMLLKLVQIHSPYDYVHLISCNDIPLMTKDYFTNYFKNEAYIGFDNQMSDNELKRRIGFYYLGNIDFRKDKLITKLENLGNQLLNINRIKNHPEIEFKKGPQWFSIKSKYISEILNFNNSIFMHGCCTDEIFIQTILGRFEDKEIQYKNDNYQAARYIDWKRGAPYVFTIKDVNELRSKVNTKFAFARKVTDPSIVDAVFNKDGLK